MTIPLSRYKQSLIKDREPINLIKEYYNIWGWQIKNRSENFHSQYSYIFDNSLKTNGIITEIKFRTITKPAIVKIKIFKKTTTQFLFKKEYIFNINNLNPVLFCHIQIKKNYKLGIYEIINSGIPAIFIYRDTNYTSNVYHSGTLGEDITYNKNIDDLHLFHKIGSIQLKIKYKKDKHYAI